MYQAPTLTLADSASFAVFLSLANLCNQTGVPLALTFSDGSGTGAVVADDLVAAVQNDTATAHRAIVGVTLGGVS